MTGASGRSGGGTGGGRLGAFLLGAVAALAAVGAWQLLVGGGVVGDVRGIVREEPVEWQTPDLPTPGSAMPYSLTPQPGAVRPLDTPTTPAAGLASHDPDGPVGILLYGTVIEPDGTPLQKPTNWLWFRSAEGRQVSARLDERGAYAATGLAAGEWTVGALIRGYRPLEASLVLAGDRPLVRHDIVIEPALVLLVAVVKPDGEPLALEEIGIDDWRDPLSVVATRERPTGDLPPISHRAYTRHGVGHFISEQEGLVGHDDPLPEGYRGRLELDALPPLWAGLYLRHVLVASQPIEPGDEEIVFVVRPEQLASLLGEVVFRVVDADTGEPLENATAELSDSQSSGPHRPADPPGSGRFRFTDQRPGLLELSLYSKGYEQEHRSVEVAPGRTTDLGDIDLDPTTTVSGVIVDTDDAPVAATYRVYPLDTYAEDVWIWSRRIGQSDAEGRFERTHLGRERYIFSVRSPAWAAPPHLVDTRAGDVTDVVVRVAASTRVHVKHEHDEARTLQVSLWTTDGLPVTRWSRPGGGSLELHLAPGEYRYVLSEDGIEVGEGAWTIGSEPATLTLSP